MRGSSRHPALRNLAHVFCIAGGVVGPVLPIIGGSDNASAFVAALGVGTLSLLSSWRLNQSTAEQADRKRQRLADARMLLENEDLFRLSDVALGRAIDLATNDPSFHASRSALASLNQAVDGFHADAAQRLKHGSHIRLRVPNLVAHELAAASNVAPDNGDWQQVVALLARRASISATPFRNHLATHLQKYVPKLTVEILKDDFDGRTPLAGRAYAVLELHARAQQRKDLVELRAYLAASHQNLVQRLTDAEERMSQHLGTIFERLSAQTLETHASLLSWATAFDRDLDRLHSALRRSLSATRSLEQWARRRAGRGLLSHERFASAFWRLAERDPNLGTLLRDPERNRLLRGPIVGRDREIAVFEAFLDRFHGRVLYWKSWPGMGKTRLCLACSEHARSRGWLPLFIVDTERNPLHALLELLDSRSSLGANSRIVLFLDSSSGAVDPSLIERLFRLPEAPEVANRAIRIKVFVTSWPHHANAIADSWRAYHWFDERELRSLKDSPSFQQLIVSLIGTSAAEAHSLVQSAEGNPLVTLLAAPHLINGSDHLVGLSDSRAIVSACYHHLLFTALGGRRAHGFHALLDTLRLMAMLGRIQLYKCNDAAMRERLTILSHWGLLARAEDDALVMSPELFRIAVAGWSLDSSSDLCLPRGAEDWAMLASPYILEHFAEIWSITLRAVSGTSNLANKARALVLACVRMRAEHVADREMAIDVAKELAGATTVERDSYWCAQIADAIGDLVPRFPFPEIAQAQAEALRNAIAVETTPQNRTLLAKKIATILGCFALPRIMRIQMGALQHAVASEQDPRVCSELNMDIVALQKRLASLGE